MDGMTDRNYNIAQAFNNGLLRNVNQLSMLFLLFSLIITQLQVCESTVRSTPERLTGNRRHPDLIPLRPQARPLKSYSSHGVCREALMVLTRLNYKKCFGGYEEGQIRHTIYSIFAHPCEEGVPDCDAKFLCMVDKNFRGCDRDFLQEGMEAAGWMRFYCPKHLNFVFNSPNNPEKTHGRCINDEQLNSRRASEFAHQRLEAKQRTKQNIVSMLSEVEPGEGNTSSELDDHTMELISDMLMSVGPGLSCIDYYHQGSSGGL